jgi:hypothetical protein
MAVARYKTAGLLINAAARELGLPVATDPFASSDPNMRQLCQHLNTLGLGLLDAYDWEHLMRTHSFATIAGQTAYDLPDDYHKTRDETQWNVTAKTPLAGPLSPQAWQQRVATGNTSPSYLEFRLTTNQILFTSSGVTVGGDTVTFEYKSRAWVRPSSAGLGNGNTLGTEGADEVVAVGDYPLFDPLVLHFGLKLLWRAGKQFNTETNLADFVRALEDAKGRSKGAKSLSMAPAFTQRQDEKI